MSCALFLLVVVVCGDGVAREMRSNGEEAKGKRLLGERLMRL